MVYSLSMISCFVVRYVMDRDCAGIRVIAGGMIGGR